MGAPEKGILSDLLKKETYDARGSQERILRLAKFDKTALWHMLSYRIFIFVSFIVGFAILASALLNASYLDSTTVRVLTLLVWLLFTSQIYATAKAMVLIASRGLASDYINKSFLNFAGQKRRLHSAYGAFPYIVLAVWLIGFAILFWMWFI